MAAIELTPKLDRWIFAPAVESGISRERWQLRDAKGRFSRVVNRWDLAILIGQHWSENGGFTRQKHPWDYGVNDASEKLFRLPIGTSIRVGTIRAKRLRDR